VCEEPVQFYQKKSFVLFVLFFFFLLEQRLRPDLVAVNDGVVRTKRLHKVPLKAAPHVVALLCRGVAADEGADVIE